jgi:hypothetical protein
VVRVLAALVALGSGLWRGRNRRTHTTLRHNSEVSQAAAAFATADFTREPASLPGAARVRTIFTVLPLQPRPRVWTLEGRRIEDGDVILPDRRLASKRYQLLLRTCGGLLEETWGNVSVRASDGGMWRHRNHGLNIVMELIYIEDYSGILEEHINRSQLI